jgi:pyridoxal phosphate enzyme (YggS family)
LAESLPSRLAAVRTEVEGASRRAGRDPATVRIVAVTKTFPPDVVEGAFAAGLEDIGENYVQEATAKRAATRGGGRWHLIGGLQRNKVRAAVATFDWVHTVDSPALAAALGAEAARLGRRLDVLVQVRLGGGPGRRGVLPEEVQALAAAVVTAPGLGLRGLMTMPPEDADHDAARRQFRLVRELRDRTAERLGVELPHLSMGMSDDFTVAVEEGATMLRLGRALFGARGPGSWRPGSSAGGEGS